MHRQWGATVASGLILEELGWQATFFVYWNGSSSSTEILVWKVKKCLPRPWFSSCAPRCPGVLQQTHRDATGYLKTWREAQDLFRCCTNCKLKVVHRTSIKLCSIPYHGLYLWNIVQSSVEQGMRTMMSSYWNKFLSPEWSHSWNRAGPCESPGQGSLSMSPISCLLEIDSSIHDLPWVPKGRFEQLLMREGRGCRVKGGAVKKQ